MNKINTQTTNNLDGIASSIEDIQKNKILKAYRQITQRNTRFFSLCAIAAWEHFLWITYVACKGNKAEFAKVIRDHIIPDLMKTAETASNEAIKAELEAKGIVVSTVEKVDEEQPRVIITPN